MDDTEAPAIVAVAERVVTMVGAIDDTTLYLAIRAECPPPLGAIEIRVKPEHAAQIVADLTMLLHLDTDQLGQLMQRLQQQD